MGVAAFAMNTCASTCALLQYTCGCRSMVVYLCFDHEGCRTCLAKNCNKSSEFVDNVSNKLNDFDNMHCINNIITHIYWFFMNNVLITDVQLYGIVLHMNMVLPSLRQCHKVGAAIVTM